MARSLCAVACIAAIAACGGDDEGVPPPAPPPDPPTELWTSLGEVPAAAAAIGDHTPLVVAGNEVFVGTSEGVWWRPIGGAEEWQTAGPERFRVFALRGDPENEDVLFAGGAPDRFDEPTFYRSEDRGRHWTPAEHWYVPPRPQESVPISGLAVLPGNSQVLYATVNADLALSSDGGMTWALPDGRTEEFFGYPCVIQIVPTTPLNFVSGCEALLDFATIESVELDPDDPFDFAHAGPWQVGFDDLGNRRPNSFAYDPAKPETLYAGVEGGLLAQTNGEIEWIFQGGEPDTPWPYTYVTAIWPDPDDAEHLIFGGKPNSVDARLSLFETDDFGASIDMIEPPETFQDPAVIQFAPSGAGDLIVLISDGDGSLENPRRLLVYRLMTR